ncbi:MAG: hypothetical protein AB7R40_26240 [Nitrospiraceae bacterium]
MPSTKPDQLRAEQVPSALAPPFMLGQTGPKSRAERGKDPKQDRDAKTPALRQKHAHLLGKQIRLLPNEDMSCMLPRARRRD